MMSVVKMCVVKMCLPKNGITPEGGGSDGH